MTKRLNEFVTDYKEMVLKPNNEWLKKHWKGYTVFCAAIFVVSAVGTYTYIRVKDKKEAEEYAINLNAYGIKED